MSQMFINYPKRSFVDILTKHDALVYVLKIAGKIGYGYLYTLL